MIEEEDSSEDDLEEKTTKENKSKGFILASIIIIFVVFIIVLSVKKEPISTEKNNGNEVLLNVSEKYAEVARAFEDCLSSVTFYERKECVRKIGITDEAKNAILLAVDEHCKNLINKHKNAAEGSLEYCLFTVEILFDEQFNCSLLKFSDNEAFCNALLSNNIKECSKIDNPNLRPLCFSELGY